MKFSDALMQEQINPAPAHNSYLNPYNSFNPYFRNLLTTYTTDGIPINDADNHAAIEMVRYKHDHGRLAGYTCACDKCARKTRIFACLDALHSHACWIAMHEAGVPPRSRSRNAIEHAGLAQFLEWLPARGKSSAYYHHDLGLVADETEGNTRCLPVRVHVVDKTGPQGNRSDPELNVPVVGRLWKVKLAYIDALPPQQGLMRGMFKRWEDWDGRWKETEYNPGGYGGVRVLHIRDHHNCGKF